MRAAIPLPFMPTDTFCSDTLYVYTNPDTELCYRVQFREMVTTKKKYALPCLSVEKQLRPLNEALGLNPGIAFGIAKRPYWLLQNQ